jgi:hypothetical protein
VPRYSVAHIYEQGQDMLIFPLDREVHHWTSEQQNELLAELEWRANDAGLAGSAVIVWEYGNRFYYLGPRLWSSFLGSIDMRWVRRNLNREISW